MIKIAIIRENGLFYGGTEKFLQIMAAETNHEEFQIDYYTTDLMRSDSREEYLINNNVNIIKFKVKKHKILPIKDNWKDFWNKFDESKYDIVQIARFYGWIEEPFCRLKNSKICEFTVFHPYITLDGVKHHILNSEWLQNEWYKTGGPIDKSSVIPVPVKVTSNKNLRESLGIENDTICMGFHQRKDDGLFSPVQLNSFKQLEQEFNNIHMVVMNGSDLYKKQAKDLEIQNISFVPFQEDISPFLNTLNIYTHGRKDGETYGMVLTEAMIHKLPVVSHITPFYNAQKSIIQDSGFVAKNDREYAYILKNLIEDSDLRNTLSNRAFELSNEFTYESVIPKIENVWRSIYYGE